MFPFENKIFDMVSLIKASLCISFEKVDRFFATLARVLQSGDSFNFAFSNSNFLLRQIYPEFRKQRKFHVMRFRYYSSTFILDKKKLGKNGFSEVFQRVYRLTPFLRASQDLLISVLFLLGNYTGIRFLFSQLAPCVFWDACQKG